MKYPFPAKSKIYSCSKFASFFTVAFLTIVVITVLFLLFPKKELLRNIAQQQKADVVALKYLQNLLPIYPFDVNLKLLLAEQNISHGDIQKTIKLITPYIKQNPTSKNDWRALWLYYQVVRTETYAEPEISYARKRGMEKIRGFLEQLSKDPFLSAEELLQLADDAISTNEPKLAISIYKKVVGMELTAKQPSSLYEKAAKVALAYGEYETCAKLYFLAQQQAKTLGQKRKYYISGLKALQSGNLLDKIMQVAQKNIGELQNDQQTLLFLNNLALAANNPAAAEKHMKKALQLKHLVVENK
jgi:polysaccharide biosynthesis protein PelB